MVPILVKHIGYIVFIVLFISLCVVYYRVTERKYVVVRIATMPSGSEVTGLATNQFDEVFLNAQHPAGKTMLDIGAIPATVGYIHGFDDEDISGRGLSIPRAGQRAYLNVAVGEYVTLAKAGDPIDAGQEFGGVYSSTGELMYVSNNPDFNGFVPLSTDSAYLYTGWEGSGANVASAISRMELDRVDGQWVGVADNSFMLDLSPIHGAAVLCSGVVSPWGTPLIGEEYLPYNTSIWNRPVVMPATPTNLQSESVKPIASMSQYLGAFANPYRYGFLLEILNPNSPDDYSVVKHFSTGRYSHESVTIMPDQKTVYLTDDTTALNSNDDANLVSGGLLFKFVADRERDLTSGTLFAAKLTQDNTSNPRKAGFDVEWIELGSSSDAEIEGWIEEYDDVGPSDYVAGQSSYISDHEVVAWAEGVSSRDLNGDGVIQSYKDSRPAFLETRRASAALGATIEWNKLEGITRYGSNVYITVAALSASMDKEWGHKHWSTGVRDRSDARDIGLASEKCGATYIAITGNDYDINRLDPLIVGKTSIFGKCDAGLPANPDNILALASGRLLVGEDASGFEREQNMLWMIK